MRKNICDRCHKEVFSTTLFEIPKRAWLGDRVFVDLCGSCIELLQVRVKEFLNEGDTSFSVVRFLGRVLLGQKEKNTVSSTVSNARTSNTV